MNQLVFIENNQLLTDSLTIAKEFGKRHDNVLRDIKEVINKLDDVEFIIQAKEFGVNTGALKFEETPYINEQNKQTYIKYLLNFDAFMLVTMGYTTQKAMLIKIKYINEFNRMKNELINRQNTYLNDYLNLSEEDRAIAYFKEKKERKALETKMKENKPIVDYYNLILSSTSSVTTTQIAQDYGLTAYQLNKILHDEGVQYKVNGQWILYGKYKNTGYVDSHTFDFIHKDGRKGVKMCTRWTQKGRKFIHEILAKRGIKPQIELLQVAK